MRSRKAGSRDQLRITVNLFCVGGMSMNRFSRSIVGAFAAVALVSFLSTTTAEAALILDAGSGLTLNTDPTIIYQQQESAPCVIGGENCLNGTFPYTVNGSGGSGEIDQVFSPIYTTAQITSVTGGSTFIIALDYNDTSAAQRLNVFTATYCTGAVCTTQTFDIATSLTTNNNGVGFSDFLLTGFLIPVGTTTIQFYADWFNNDGPDRYFIVGVNTPGTPVPEPATLSLFGLGLLGVARRVVRRKA